VWVGVFIFDIQGWITLALGCLLALITLFSSYSHIQIPFAGTVALNQQVGVLLLDALVPPLLVDAELVIRCRLRAERDRVREAEDRARAEDEAARLQGRHLQRADAIARSKAQCALAILEFIHDPDPAARKRLRDVMALIREYPELA
jgi:hypothetical protein